MKPTTDAPADADCLRELHALLVEHFTEFDAFAEACLDRGRRMLGLATGIISHISGQDYEVVKVRTPLDGLHDGDHFTLADTYCAAVIERVAPVGYAHVGELPDMRNHPVYVGLQLESYLGVPLRVGGAIYGTLNFSDTAVRRQNFTALEIECIEAMAALLGRFIEAEQTDRALAEREHLFAQSFRHALVGKALATPERRIIDVNPALCHLLGYPRETLIEHTPDAFTHPDDRHLTDDLYRELFAGEREHFEVEKRYLHADGRIVHARLGIALVRHADGRPWLAIGQLVDLTAAKQRERELHALLDAVPEALVVVSAALEVVRVNAAAEHLFGYSQEALIGQPVGLLMPEHVRKRQLALLRDAPAQAHDVRHVDNTELRGLRADGSEFPCEISMTVTEIEGQQQSLVAVRDVTERRRMQAELVRLAESDPLTGLANRRVFDQTLAREHTRLRRGCPALSLALLDLDHFKRVNDRFGHAVGDRVLVRLAQVLCETARETDMPARLGGEEFGVLLPDTGLAAAEVFAERLREALHRADWPIPEVTASIGVAALCDASVSTESLYRAADQALYAAKGAGRDRVMLADSPCVGRPIPIREKA
ncbi:diguanylate cyclase [Acidihalobacter ferrooxydans]|uniref:PAS domain S-box protein n=1 Tax=Acidihalobacter ferrooxydans TaxID=1765967 RepID=A0A1P8UF22_9GAMM|nr:diguanylate cyclase [Acidihalobacter ferrooxydans]APZ42406.1 hypothetical protein BW247_04310 [Acidihalobacter ferrooxydans]